VIDGAADPWRRKRGQVCIRVGRRRRVAAIGFGQDRFPFSHPTASGVVLAALALHDGGVEETGRKAGQPALGPHGAAEGREGGAQVVGRAPPYAHGRAGQATNGGADRPPTGGSEPGHRFTFCLPFVYRKTRVYFFFTFCLPKFSPANPGPGRGIRRRGFRPRGW